MLLTPLTRMPSENKQICSGANNCIPAETCRNENFTVLNMLYIVNIKPVNVKRRLVKQLEQWRCSYQHLAVPVLLLLVTVLVW